jgi:succinate dehydrogenase / fumarate reductase cytochrome b subunit
MGLVFGGYIAVHLIVNATGLRPRDYQMNVDKIHSLEPMLWLIELTAIFIPLLLHALYGIYISWSGVKFNTTKYAYGGNLRYALQRWTAVFLLVFLAVHIGTLHRWGLAGVADLIHKIHPTPTMVNASGITEVDAARYDGLNRFADWCGDFGLFNAHNQAFQSTVSGVHTLWDGDRPWSLGNWVFMIFYLVGIWCATFHFANGLWTAAIAWGLTITARSQQRWGHVCLGFGIVLTLIGTIAWYAFTLSPKAQDTGRWDDLTHTLPDEDTTHEQDQPSGVKAEEKAQGMETGQTGAATVPSP